MFGVWNLALNGSIRFLYGPDGDAPLILILISLFLCVFTATSAVWAFVGDREGKVATLIFVTLDVLWWTLLVILAIVENHLEPDLLLRYIIEMIPPFVWLGFIWFKFTRPDLTAYYDYQASLVRTNT